MEGYQYQELAMRTTKDEWRGKCCWDQKIHAIMGLNSEAGEIAGLIQKMYQGHKLDIEHMKKEIGDAMWFIAEICDAFNLNLDEIMQLNIAKLKARYPDGFEEYRSLNRNDGDI